MTKGIYALILQNDNDKEIAIGSLGLVRFHMGFYVYVGSAMGRGPTSVENRVRRHFSGSKKKHWHIDYLLEHVEIYDVLWAKSDVRLECSLVQEIVNMNEFEYGPKSFGNSDCKSFCQAHILKYKGFNTPMNYLIDAFSKLGLVPHDHDDMELRND